MTWTIAKIAAAGVLTAVPIAALGIPVCAAANSGGAAPIVLPAPPPADPPPAPEPPAPSHNYEYYNPNDYNDWWYNQGADGGGGGGGGGG